MLRLKAAARPTAYLSTRTDNNENLHFFICIWVKHTHSDQVFVLAN